jgi:hypothetical protein
MAKNPARERQRDYILKSSSVLLAKSESTSKRLLINPCSWLYWIRVSKI